MLLVFVGLLQNSECSQQVLGARTKSLESAPSLGNKENHWVKQDSGNGLPSWAANAREEMLKKKSPIKLVG